MATVLAETISEELAARGWTPTDVAIRMGGKSVREMGIDQLCVEMILAIDRPNLRLDEETARKLGRAFGVSPEFFINLAKAGQSMGTDDEDTTLEPPNANRSATSGEGRNG